MYGTIMRARLRKDRRDGFVRYMQEMESGFPELQTSGWLSSELAFEDKDPDRILMIVRFKDKESYVRNAGRPETNANYRRMLEFFEAPPEWIDVRYIAMRGQPVQEYEEVPA